MDDFLNIYFQQPPPRIEDKQVYTKVLDAQYFRLFRKSIYAFPLLVLTMGVLYLLYTIFSSAHLDGVRLFVGPTDSVKGTVLKTVKKLKGSDSIVYRYEFEFNTADGKKETALRAHCFGDERTFEPGDQVKVNYLRYNPEIACIDDCRTTASSIIGPVIVVLLLTLMSFFPLLLFSFQHKWIKKAIINGDVIVTTILDGTGYGFESPTCTIEFNHNDQRISSNAIVGYNKDEIINNLVKEKTPVRILFIPDSPEKCIVLDLLDIGPDISPE